MDTQAGAQSATNSQTTIDLQTGIISGHQDEIGRANVKLADQAAEIDRLKIVVADRNAKVAELMGAVARAGMAAPAAPSEQVEPSEGQQGTLSIERIVKNAILGNSHPCDEGYLMFLNEDEVTTVAWQVGLATRAAAPAAPLLDQPEQSVPTDLSKRLREIASNKDADAVSFLKHQLVLAADEIERLAAPLPELTGPSILSDQKFVVLLSKAVDSGNPEALAAYLNSRFAASPSPAPAPTEIDADVFYPPKAALKREDWDAKTHKPKVEPQDGLVLPLVAAPVSQHAALVSALKTAEAALADIGDADREPGDDVAWCEARAASALPKVRAALAEVAGSVPREGGDTKPIDAESSPASRMGGITSKESAAPVESQPDQPMEILSDVEVMRLREVGAAWMSQDGRDALDDWLLGVQSPPVESAIHAAPGASTEDKQ